MKQRTEAVIKANDAMITICHANQLAPRLFYVFFFFVFGVFPEPLPHHFHSSFHISLSNNDATLHVRCNTHTVSSQICWIMSDIVLSSPLNVEISVWE